MELLIFLGGVILGAVIANILRFEHTAFGVLNVDHDKDLVSIHLSSPDLSKVKKKKVVLKVNHNANLNSQE